MASTSGSDTASDITSGSENEQAIRDIVLAAGEKAGVDSLCEQCNQIVGWFFLDREVYKETFNAKNLDSWYICIRDLEIDKFSPRCKLCNFIWAMGPAQQEDVYLREDFFHLVRATVGATFDFRSCYHDSPIFYLAPPSLGNRLENEVCRGPKSNSPIFGFANADPTRDGVAIRNLAAYADLSLIREWIQLCDDRHTDCSFGCLSVGGISLQGFKVIDCESGNILVPATTSMSYVTLSYVWGSEQAEGPDQFGRLPAVLPELIEGVLQVVKALGYRYLWIDRYCIPQTDSSITKKLLIRNMDKIYSNSKVTIIAATSTCPSDGLAGITKPRVVEQQSLKLNSIRLLQWTNNVREEVQSSVWNTRGWTYQEGLLARRRLVFTEKQCYFQCGAGGDFDCKEGSRMESIDYDLKTDKFPFRDAHIQQIFPSRPKPFDRYDVSGFQDRVNDYTQRQLTEVIDVLPAFSGILAMYISESPAFHGHMHGVPLLEPKHEFLRTDAVGALITSITWYFEIHDAFDIATTTIPIRRRNLPSWTWCDWTYASPSLYPIKWESGILETGLPRRDMVIYVKLSLEFENGAMLPWSRDSSVEDLATEAMSMGDVHSLHVYGWFTHLPIPSCTACTRLDPNWDYWSVIPSGPYHLHGSTVAWLHRLAEEREMETNDDQDYLFKAWVFAPMVPDDYHPREPRFEAFMMILDETIDPGAFERVEICKVIMGDRGEDWAEQSVEDMAEMFGWEMKAFKLV